MGVRVPLWVGRVESGDTLSFPKRSLSHLKTIAIASILPKGSMSELFLTWAREASYLTDCVFHPCRDTISPIN